jgi:nitrite reductase/ring-hydroxylating ferredoxin subunit
VSPAEEIDLTRVLCTLTDLAATGSHAFRLGGGDWPLKGFVVSVADGARAYVNRCAHLAYPLNLDADGFLTPDGSMILCHVHGAIFEKATGYCVAGPCFGMSLSCVPVTVRNGCVLLADEVDLDALIARYA